VHHLLRSIADGSDVAPHGATFEDGYRATEIAEAIVRSSAAGRREQLTFRTL
jgi:predicted dehydrogenase